MKTRRLVIGVSLGVYLVGFGMLAGMTLDRMRYDRQRSEVIAQYERSLTQLNAHRMALEKLAEVQR